MSGQNLERGASAQSPAEQECKPDTEISKSIPMKGKFHTKNSNCYPNKPNLTLTYLSYANLT